MHCHLATCVFQKLQDKNDGSGDELQKKEEEDAQKPPLNEEQAQHSAATIEEVKLHKLILRKYKVVPWLKLTTFMIEQLQDKNHDSDDEHQNKEQEDTQETTLNEEQVEQSASPTTAQQVKLHKIFPQNYTT